MRLRRRPQRRRRRGAAHNLRSQRRRHLEPHPNHKKNAKPPRRIGPSGAGIAPAAASSYEAANSRAALKRSPLRSSCVHPF